MLPPTHPLTTSRCANALLSVFEQLKVNSKIKMPQ